MLFLSSTTLLDSPSRQSSLTLVLLRLQVSLVPLDEVYGPYPASGLITVFESRGNQATKRPQQLNNEAVSGKSSAAVRRRPSLTRSSVYRSSLGYHTFIRSLLSHSRPLQSESGWKKLSRPSLTTPSPIFVLFLSHSPFRHSLPRRSTATSSTNATVCLGSLSPSRRLSLIPSLPSLSFFFSPSRRLRRRLDTSLGDHVGELAYQDHFPLRLRQGEDILGAR